MEVAPDRGIPNFGGNPDQIVAVCPTKIRYTFPGTGDGQGLVKLNDIVLAYDSPAFPVSLSLRM